MQDKDYIPKAFKECVRFEPELLRAAAKKAKCQNLSLSSYICRLIHMDVNCQHSSTLFSRKDQSAADGSKEISNDTEDYRDIREVEDSTD